MHLHAAAGSRALGERESEGERSEEIESEEEKS
jgi:hypothetical protein